VVSSHFWPGRAPHVGQRTASICLSLGFLVFTVIYDAETRSKKMFNLVQKTRRSFRLVVISNNHNLPQSGRLLYCV
jgi:hypothetical protein